MLRTEGSQERLDNLAELKQSIHEYEVTCGEESTLEDHPAHVALFSNGNSIENYSRYDVNTIHLRRSDGRLRAVVYIAAVFGCEHQTLLEIPGIYRRESVPAGRQDHLGHLSGQRSCADQAPVETDLLSILIPLLLCCVFDYITGGGCSPSLPTSARRLKGVV